MRTIFREMFPLNRTKMQSYAEEFNKDAGPYPLAFASDQQGSGDEQGSACAAEQIDGLAIGSLHCRRCRPGIVEALRTALAEALRSYAEQQQTS